MQSKVIEKSVVKSIQGISCVWVGKATKLHEQDFQQLELSLRGATPAYKQFILTFNPTDQSHWLQALLPI